MKVETRIRNGASMNNSNCSTAQQFNKLASQPLTNSSTHLPNNTPIIQVKHLSKRYQIGMDRTYKTFCESFTDTIKSPLKRLKSFSRQEEVFWALKDVNFEVFPGEVVGIIGRNGAILGMRKAEIDTKFDEIVAFSRIENFIDTPVKRTIASARC